MNILFTVPMLVANKVIPSTHHSIQAPLDYPDKVLYSKLKEHVVA
jgi:hypothetical protein